MDSSAIVKIYVNEAGSAWVKSLCTASSNIISIIRITMVEVASALARKHRAGEITEHERNRALAWFLYDCRNQYQVVEVDSQVVNIAIQLTQRYSLRGYDAVQLATAIRINRALVANHLSPLVFVSADGQLCSVAVMEGLITQVSSDKLPKSLRLRKFGCYLTF